MKRLGVFLLPPGGDGMLVHHRVTPHPPIYTPQWREALLELSVLPKNTTEPPWPGLKPGPLTQESSTLTMSPPHLSQQFMPQKTAQPSPMSKNIKRP